MSKYLITSRSGAGKSAICCELQRRGLPAFDTDKIAGLSGWFDHASGRPADVDYALPIIDPLQYVWNWDTTVLQTFLEEHPILFLCGSADNSDAFFAKFDQVFVLTIDSEVLRRRLQSRVGHHGYGKSSAMQDIIVREQAAFVEQALALGAAPIDANPPIKQVVEAVLAAVK